MINNDKGITVLHPDTLISGTSVSSSFACMRRAVLNERIKVWISKYYRSRFNTMMIGWWVKSCCHLWKYSPQFTSRHFDIQ